MTDSDSSLEDFNKRVDVDMDEATSPLKVGTALKRRSKLGQMFANANREGTLAQMQDAYKNCKESGDVEMN